MKHIFIVHSPVTYIVAVGIILKKNIQSNDVLILGDNWNFKDGPYEIQQICLVSLKDIIYRPLKNCSYFLNPHLSLYEQIDGFVQKEDFRAYVPILDNTKKLIVVHPKCIGFDYFEEGTEAYCFYDTISDYTNNYGTDWFYEKGIASLMPRLRNAFNSFRTYSPKLDAIPFAYPAYAADPNITFWSLSSFSFPNAKRKEEVRLNEILCLFEKTGVSIPVFIESMILIWDSRYERMFDKTILSRILTNKIIPLFRGKKILLKFHHKDKEFQRKFLIDLLERNDIQFTVLPDTTIMEFVFMKSRDCNVFGVMSSLLLYAALFGHKAYSMTSEFKEWNERFTNKINGYKDLLIFI